MLAALKDIFEQVQRDSEVRCVVLTGTGERAFTAGIDLHGVFVDSFERIGGGGEEGEVEREDSYRKARRTRGTIVQFQAALSAVESCGKRMPFPLFFFSFSFSFSFSSFFLFISFSRCYR